VNQSLLARIFLPDVQIISDARYKYFNYLKSAKERIYPYSCQVPENRKNVEQKDSRWSNLFFPVEHEKNTNLHTKLSFN